METLLQDLRFAARSMSKSPGFMLVAVLTLALGIGANTTLFSVISFVLLRPVPFSEPDRLVYMHETHPKLERMSVSYPNFVDWREQSRDLYSHIAAWRTDGFNLTGDGTPERLKGGMVSADLFPMLGVRSELGRTFLPEEDQPNATRSVMLTHALWQRRFNEDPTIIGKSIQLNGQGYVVTGVLPRTFRFLDNDIDLYVPISLFANDFKSRGSHPGIVVVGRLKPGVTLEKAKTGMDVIAQRLEKEYPGSNSGNRVAAVLLAEDQTRDIRPALLVLWGAVAFVLLIAAANVANLMMARATSRQQEIAVRVALGAGRGRIIRQLLTESVVLSMLGGVFGVLIAMWGVDALRALMPDSIPRGKELQLDGLALAFTLGLSVLTGLAFGAFPALQAANPKLHDFLKDSRASADPRKQRLRNILVVSEVALSLVLLVGAGLMMRSFGNLLGVQPGFEPANVLTFAVDLPAGRYDNGAKLNQFADQLREKLRNTPGVETAALATGLPLVGASETSFHIGGRPVAPPGESPLAVIYSVTPEYLQAMKLRLVRGRFFAGSDGTAKVAVIDESFAKKYFPNEDPIGQRVHSGGDKAPAFEIVGVVNHVMQYGLDGKAPVDTAFYIPYAAHADLYPKWATGFAVVMRTRLPPRQLEAAARRAVIEVDAEQSIYQVRTMEEVLAENVSDRRFNLLLLGTFAALALLLAAVGIYGVMSYSVAQRTREIGIRMALGAAQDSVLWLVVGQGARLALLGVGIGLLVALGVSRALESLVYGMSATDPVTYALVALGLSSIAVLASWIPARRAMRVDPVVSLRAN